MAVLEATTLDLLPLCRSFFILDKTGSVVPFEPNWAQSEVLSHIKSDYEANKPSRLLCLKARQLGISTVAQAVVFAMAVHPEIPNVTAAVIAHESQPAEYLFGMTKRYYQTWPFRDFYPARYSSRRQLTLDGQDSTIYVMTAENPDALRGRTYRVAHASEAAFWKDPVAAMLALNQAMPPIRGNIQIIESTACGLGNWFHETWEEAVAKKNDYTPLFFPWWKHHEYIPCQGLGCRDGTCETCKTKTSGLKPRNTEERELLKLGATKAHLAWRRWAIPNRTLNNIDLWNQEFPATPEMAFIASGVNAFNLTDLKVVYKPEKPDIGKFVVSGGEVKFVTHPEGAWRIYRQPSTETVAGSKWGEYMIGADPSFGSIDGDYAAAHVLNRRTKEQVATFHGRIDPSSFADELALAGKYYNLATIAVETGGGGIATIERLRHTYPRLYQRRVFDVVPGQDRSERQIGWETTWKTKAHMILKGVETVAKGDCTIHDEATFKEARTFSFYGGRGLTDKFGPADEQHGRDDLIMAWCICIVCMSSESPLPAYEVIENPDGVIWSKAEEQEEQWQ